MKRRVGLVEDRPQVAERVLVAPVAERRGAAREVRRREQRPAFHREQSVCSGSASIGLELGLSSTQRRGQAGDQLTREPVLRLTGVAGQTRRLGAGRRGRSPVARYVAAHA